MKRTILLVCLALTACNNNPPHICAGAAIPAAPQERDPQTGACFTVNTDCGCDPCVPCACGNDQAGVLPECSGACDALDESQCLATAGCHTAYVQVGSGSGGPSFWGCWDIAPLPVLDGGTCNALDALTCMQHDDCTSQYFAGDNPTFFQGCSPKTILAACSTLTTEAACKARTDCEPVYVGSNCTCDPNTCTCQVETFDHCQAP